MFDRENLSETQLATLEKLEYRQSLVRLAAFAVMTINGLGIAMALVSYLALGDLLAERTGADLKEQIRSDFSRFDALERESRKTMAAARVLGKGVDLDLSAREVSALAEQLASYEKDYQRFYRVLKVNMFNLSQQIPGTSSWFELYSPAVDAAIERSRARELTLLEVQAFYRDRMEA